VNEVRAQFGNEDKWERPPLEIVARGLQETQLTEKT
jgi:hypothetical protein